MSVVKPFVGAFIVSFLLMGLSPSDAAAQSCECCDCWYSTTSNTHHTCEEDVEIGWTGNLHCMDFWMGRCEDWHFQTECGVFATLPEVDREALELGLPLDLAQVTKLTIEHPALFRVDDEAPQRLELTNCHGQVVRRYRLSESGEEWLPFRNPASAEAPGPASE